MKDLIAFIKECPEKYIHRSMLMGIINEKNDSWKKDFKKAKKRSQYGFIAAIVTTANSFGFFLFYTFFGSTFYTVPKFFLIDSVIKLILTIGIYFKLIVAAEIMLVFFVFSALIELQLVYFDVFSILYIIVMFGFFYLGVRGIINYHRYHHYMDVEDL